MSKKRFSISTAVNTALTQTIQMAEAENSNFRNTEILVDRIRIDPHNPRRHTITLEDIQSGLSSADPDYAIKHSEYDSLCELANSIRKDGLLNPITVIEEGGDFKLVAGERRLFATIIAKKNIIEARVFKKKPKSLDLKIVQWSENQSRQDLTLYEKLMNVSAICEAYQVEKQETLTAIKLSEIIHVSRQQAQFYMAILSNLALMSLIENGEVSTLDMARKLASLTMEQIQRKLNQVEEGKDSQKVIPVLGQDKSKNAGRKRASINLGSTKKPFVAQTIAEAILSTQRFGKYAKSFQPVDWTCLDQSTKAFQKLIEIMEKELGVPA